MYLFENAHPSPNKKNTGMLIHVHVHIRGKPSKENTSYVDIHIHVYAHSSIAVQDSALSKRSTSTVHDERSLGIF